MTRWVVVGAGAAGCVVAARLSERPDAEVVLLEAGPDHGPDPAPDDVGPYFDDPARFVTEQVVRRPGRAVEPYRQGWGIGGSSLVNGSLVVSDPDAAELEHLLPLEPPWSDGPVGTALLASDPSAIRVALARHDGHRVTIADAYLRPAAERPNLTVRPGCRVDAVELAGTRVTGVRTVEGEVVSGDRVVLCAGAIRSPTILLRSAVDVPGIGDGLQDHPAFTITLALRPEVVDPTSPTIAVADAQPDHQILALNHLPGHPGLGALNVGLLRVSSTGRVTVDAAGEPVVELHQLATADDRRGLTAAVERAVGLLDHPAWAEVVTSAFADDVGTPIDAVDEWEDWIVDHLGGHHHVAATCRDGVVTDAGRLRGHHGLFVCDASVFPGVPPRNPYLSLVTLAERLVAGWS